MKIKTELNKVWSDPPQSLSIPGNEIHVWRISVLKPSETLKPLWDVLSEDERKRAGRFHFKKDKNLFIISHGALRNILSRYLKVEPCEIKYHADSHGKPKLHEEIKTIDLRFNLSHSSGLAMCAVGLGRDLGIDVQFIKDGFRGREIAERFFSSAEVSELFILPQHQQGKAFFRCWTRKEAFIKARGMGLSIPLNQFAVSLAPGQPAALLNTRWDARETGRWTLEDIDAGQGYAAAIAVAGHGLELKYWNWAG